MSRDEKPQYGDVIQDFAAQLVLFHETVADQLGLNATDLKCAGILRRKGPLTGKELAESMHLTTAAITKILDKLERAGFITREKHQTDRRSIIARVIPEAQERIEKLYASFAQSMSQLFGTYSNDEIKLIFDFIIRARSVFIEETAKLRNPLDDE
jgi:DNA-binding MarR family transcriptional regulator